MRHPAFLGEKVNSKSGPGECYLLSGCSECWRPETNLGDQRKRRKAGNIQVRLYCQPGGSLKHLSTPGLQGCLICFQTAPFEKI